MTDIERFNLNANLIPYTHLTLHKADQNSLKVYAYQTEVADNVMKAVGVVDFTTDFNLSMPLLHKHGILGSEFSTPELLLEHLLLLLTQKLAYERTNPSNS